MNGIFQFTCLSAVLGWSFIAVVPAQASPVSNLSDYVQALSLTPLYAQAAVRSLRIAILDNGFDGYQTAVTSGALPSNTRYIAGPIPAPANPETHGLVMAEVLYGLLTNEGAAPQFAPAEFRLYNTYGFTNFETAVKDLVADPVDLVLYAQNWEYGGNLDGHGFIDAVVGRATSAGIVWINSSGDFGDTTYNYSVTSAAGAAQGVEIRCAQNAAGKCKLRLVLSWNDFKDDPNVGTAKDLDLVLNDDESNEVGASRLIQVATENGLPGYSLYPREIIEVEVKPGSYFAQIEIKSSGFGPADTMRLTASGDFITLPAHSTTESLLVPADRSDVIAIGASDTEKSSKSISLGKPDLSLPSLIHLSTGEQYGGTSSASAAAAGAAALIMTETASSVSRADLLNLLKARLSYPPPMPSTASAPGQGLDPQSLGFSYTGPGCYMPYSADDARAPDYVRQLITEGGTLVMTTMGLKVFFMFDPITLLPGIQRQQADDLIAVSAQGAKIYPRAEDRLLPASFYEALELPKDQVICAYP